MSYKSPHLQTVGQIYHDFKLLKIIKIPELQCVMYELIHLPTDARVMHIGNDDPENLFCLSFQTFPYNSNGVAHILEHTVLCGSKKFPIKDPFFSMNRRSLNTFMNALTGSDFTCYPASTQITKDFYNLLEVYLDAVFHPELKKLSFLQEGCRLEFSDPTNPESPLEYKGIVYNEMKGSLTSAGARLAEAINSALYPQITYGFNSGGDPQEIPHLTYEQLKEFHTQFYQPSRCVFFFYGNMALEPHLDFIAEHTLNSAKKTEKIPPIPLQPRFKEPVYKELRYPIAPEEDTTNKALIAFSWLTCHIQEQEETLALQILQNILLDTDASPLKRALLKSGWCKQVSYFIDSEINEVPLGITLRGCDPDRANDIEELIKTTLKEISRQGISLELTENAIHQAELGRSEITGDAAPFGLSLFMRSALLKQHGVNPEQGLKIHSLFQQLRQNVVLDPSYFSRLIQKYYLDNTHFIRIVMLPDANLQAEEEKKEKLLLEKIKAGLSEQQIDEILQQSQALFDFQKEQEEENDDILPKITLDEVPVVTRDYPLLQQQVGVLETFHHSVFTNEIVYADIAFPLVDFTEEELFFVRLFELILTQVGSGERNYIETLDYIQGNTGGIDASISLNLQAQDCTHFKPTFHLRGKSLYRKASKLFPLLLETLESADLTDVNRLKEIILKQFTGMESRLNQNALRYAINLSSSALNAGAKSANALYGLPYFWKMREIIQDFDKQFPYVLAKLQNVQERIKSFKNPQLIISCDSQMYDELKGHGFYGLKDMELGVAAPWKGNFPREPISSQGRVIASPVAFIGKVFPTVSYVHPYAPALNVAAHLFDNLTLHPLIREKGGAYGGGAVSNSTSGNFYFYSYRDPNIAKTLSAFREAIDTVVRGDFDEADLDEGKLEKIQAFDSPVAPGTRGEIAYNWLVTGKTLELRQKFRTQLLALTKEDIIEAVREVIVPQFDTGATVVFAGKGLLEDENRKLQAMGLPPLIIENV